MVASSRRLGKKAVPRRGTASGVLINPSDVIIKGGSPRCSSSRRFLSMSMSVSNSKSISFREFVEIVLKSFLWKNFREYLQECESE